MVDIDTNPISPGHISLGSGIVTGWRLWIWLGPATNIYTGGFLMPKAKFDLIYKDLRRKIEAEEYPFQSGVSEGV